LYLSLKYYKIITWWVWYFSSHSFKSRQSFNSYFVNNITIVGCFDIGLLTKWWWYTFSFG